MTVKPSDEKLVLIQNMAVRLGTVRESMALTKRGFADLLGVPYWSNYFRYENGERLMPVEYLLKLHRLGWSLDWLHTGMGEMRWVNKKDSKPFKKILPIAGRERIGYYY